MNVSINTQYNKNNKLNLRMRKQINFKDNPFAKLDFVQ